MSEKQDEGIKRLMDRLLLKPTDGGYGTLHFFTEVVKECVKEGLDYQEPIVFGHWWNLVRIGAIIPVGSTESDASIPPLPQFSRFLLTERGRGMLEKGQASPHEPARYLEAVRQRVAEPDTIVLTYLDEAVGAWSCALYRSSAVMLGCACERLVNVLANHIAQSGIDFWAKKAHKKIREEPARISQLFELIRRCLTDLKNTTQIPGRLGDALDRRLSSIFDRARWLRNKSGHPTGAAVTYEEALAGLILFPDFYVFVDELCKALDSLTTALDSPTDSPP